MSGPQRIVCLTEETTETLYRLGAQDRIVGISAFTVRPREAKIDKPVVSQYVRADCDKIEALDPDMVLAFSDLQADICADLIKRGLAVVCFNQRDISGILEMILTLGRLVGEAHRAEVLASQLERNLEDAMRTAATLPVRPRVFFEEWPDPIMTGIGWVSQIITAAGGIDCFVDLAERKLAKDRTVTPDDVLERRPELYLASWCGKPFRREIPLARPGYAKADFTREGRMVEIPSSVILQPGPACLTDGLRLVQDAIARVAAELAT